MTDRIAPSGCGTQEVRPCPRCPCSPRLHALATEDGAAVRALLGETLAEEGFRVSFSSAQEVADLARLRPDPLLVAFHGGRGGTG